MSVSIPPLFRIHAELAAVRYKLPKYQLPLFDHWFAEQFGFQYGQEREPLPPHLKEVFPRYKQPEWIAEWYNTYDLETELLTMLSQTQIQNTLVFLSRAPSNGAAEAAELVSLVQLYQSLLPENAPTAEGSTEPETVPESENEPTNPA